MKRMIAALALAAACAQAEIRQVKPALYLLPPAVATPQPLAERVEAKARRAAAAERHRALNELAGVVGETNATTSAGISNQVARIRERAHMLRGLGAVVADTRSNIVETAGMSDAEVAGLYIAQMRKSVPGLLAAARTNTLEHVIGAGMRQDLKKP